MIEIGRLFGRNGELPADLIQRLQIVDEEVNYAVDSCILAGPRRRAVFSTATASRSRTVTMEYLTDSIHSGKTSLLFQYAFSKALDGERVTFVCKRRKITQQFPAFQETPESPGVKEALEGVTMQYAADSSELELFLASLPHHPTVPAVLIIDDLSEYYPGPVHNRKEADRYYLALGLLREAMRCLRKRGVALSVLASLTLVEDAYASLRDPRLSLHWVQMLCMIYGGQGSFELSVSNVLGAADPANFIAKFVITADAVQLRMIASR